MRLYPPALVRRMGLSRIDLVDGLEWGGERRGGLYDPETWTVFLDSSLWSRWEAFGRRGLHHELFHSIDGWTLRGAAGEEDWNELNPPAFRYAPEDKRLRWPLIALAPYAGETGFVTRYSMSAGAEDRAEVFSFLMSDPEYLEERMKEDRVLQRKVGALRQFLRRLCGEFDDGYWQERRRRKPAPWRDPPGTESLRVVWRDAIRAWAARPGWGGATRAASG